MKNIYFLSIIFLFSTIEAGSNIDIFQNVKDGNIFFVKQYIKNKQNINIQHEGNESLLLFAIQSNQFDIAYILINSGADVNLGGIYGMTPLMAASSRGNVKLISELISKGARLNTQDYSGWCALYQAISGRHYNAVKYILEKGANVNIKLHGSLEQYNPGFTSLHFAVESGDLDICNLLIQYGAKVNETADNKKTPIDLARENNHMEIIQLLIKSGAK